ncbi:tricalbin [Marasmius fiardii PR-910]|nr:tricalbin [Marasmius fiardii PR-910]
MASANGNGQLDGDARVAVHSFDPDATPQQKAADAGKAKDQLSSVKDTQKQPTEREVAIDRGGGSAVVPTITVEDTDSTSKKLKVEGKVASPEPTVPGGFPAAPVPGIPDWYIVGWRQASGIDKPPVPEGEERDNAVLSLFLSEQFYGQWYHNAAIIVFAIFVSHFFTRFNFGWGWLFILLAVCNTYYATSMERVRRRSRDDIQRELVKTRLGSEHESAEWLNNFLDRFWLIYEPVLSATIISSVDQVLSSNTPAFLDSLRLSEFTLGTKAPRIDRVHTHPKTDDDIVMMDWALSFTPNDLSNMTPRQVAAKVNPKIILSVRVGKGLAVASMPILLEDITFSGLMRIRMKLMSNFPHVQIVDICFLEKPVIDYVLKPIGGETFGFDIANIPGLSSFIRDMTHATLAPMMYDPNVFTLNLEQLLSGVPLDAAIGVVQITIHSARGIKGTKIGGGTPDPYVSISINNRAELATTKYKHNTYNPTWMETKFILVNSLHESLTLNLYDFNDHRKNSLLGTASFEMIQLQDDAVHENVSSPLLLDGKDRGELKYDVSYYPVLKPEDGETETVAESSVGIVRLTIHQAKELDSSKMLSDDLNPLAKLFLASNPRQPIHVTKTFKHTKSPVWESAHEFLCADKRSSVVTIQVIDDRDFMKDPCIGYMSVRLEDLLSFNPRNVSEEVEARDWFPLSDCKSGKIRVSAEWKPLNMAGSLHGAGEYKPPIGVVRLWLDRATDIKNVEAALGGKSDPYVRVQVNNVTKGRTEVINNNLNPVWDQIIYVPVHSVKESLLLECMDYQHLTRDRSLGLVELHLNELAEANPDDASYPYKSLGVKETQDPIRLDKKNSFKGQLHYRAEFVPALNLRGVEFEQTGDGLGGGTSTSSDTDDAGSVVTAASDVSSDQEAKTTVTIKSHSKGQKSIDSTVSNGRVGTSSVPPSPVSPTSPAQAELPTKEDKKQEERGVQMTTEELMGQQSGIIVLNVISGELARKGRLEVLLDDGYWPCFSTQRASSRKAMWSYVGEGFIKELDFGKIWLRLNEAEEGEKDDIVAEWRGDAKAFLQETLNGPKSYQLQNGEEKNTSTVTIESRYVPVPVKLEPRESINNQGSLRVTLLEGRDLRAADRGGKSDPYVVFSLNGMKVAKSQTIKKTLNPTWNEDFDISVRSRVGSVFVAEVYDWDQVGRADPLGEARIDLEEIEPFQAAERTLPLILEKEGAKGQIRVRLLFKPEVIIKQRSKTSTFSTAGRAMTQIGGLPVQAGKGVFHGVTGVFKKDHNDHPPVPPVPQITSGQASHPIGTSGVVEAGSEPFPSNGTHDRMDSGGSGSGEPGTLRVVVIDAKDLSTGDAKPYAILRLGDKEHKTKHVGKTAHPEWNETFTFSASSLTPKIYVWVHDHKTLGKDKLLGEGEIDIWRHISPETISAAEVCAELNNGSGLVRLQVEFDPTNKPLGRRSSISSSDKNMSRTISMTSPSRFSLRGRRPGTSGADNDD